MTHVAGVLAEVVLGTEVVATHCARVAQRQVVCDGGAVLLHDVAQLRIL